MADKIVSPGVFTRENDLSQLTEGPIAAGAAIIGPAVKGPVEEPTLVTSYSDYISKFGTTLEYSGSNKTYFTSIAAYNYFNQGGETLLVTRVVPNASGSFTSAVSTQIPNGGPSGSLNSGPDALLGSITTSPSASGGAGGALTIVTSSNFGNELTASITLNTATTVVESITITSQSNNVSMSVGDTLVFTSESLGATIAGGTDLTLTITQGDLLTTASFELSTIAKGANQNSDNNSGSLIEQSGGVNPSGSSDDIRWEISNVDTTAGTFNLLIRRGNDSQKEKVILETWNNLSLDPFADNYISKVIGDQYNTIVGTGTDKYLQVNGSYSNRSRYVYVSSITDETPNYLNAAGERSNDAYTASLPLISSGNFHNANGDLFYTSASFYGDVQAGDIQGLKADDYTQSLYLLNNPDLYNYNLLTFPGITTQQAGVSSTVITTALANADAAGNHLVIFDTSNYGESSVAAVTGRTDAYNTSYAATYWPWCQVVDSETGQRVFVPASTAVLAAYAFNDKNGEPWFAPAGVNRGVLDNVIRTEKTVTKAERDTLYEARVNPIATFAGTGVTVFGQKTLQKKASALDRINVRRLLLNLKEVIGNIGKTLVFENNTTVTRNSFVSQATQYLESVQQRQGVYAFKVVMDTSNNTPDVIDRNQLVGQIYVQPAKSAEFVILDFNILPTGAEFPS
jgi:hypothetical protein